MSFDPITYAMAKSYSDSKGGYVEPGKKILSARFTDSSYQSAEAISLVVGKEYSLTLYDDNSSEKLEVGRGIAQTVDAVTYVGNISLFIGDDAPDTGEPFIIVSMQTGTMILNTVSVNGKFIVEQTETLHPIDPKFLPGVCLPVVMDCDAMGITEVLGELLAAGGGTALAKNVESETFWHTSLDSPNVIIRATVGSYPTFFYPSFVELEDGDTPGAIVADIYVDYGGFQKCFVSFVPGSKGNGVATTYITLVHLGEIG